MSEPFRSDLTAIFQAGVAAVSPDQAIVSHLHIDGDSLCICGRNYALNKGRVIVLGAGKGAAPMAMALENMLGERIDDSLVVVKYDHGLPLEHIKLAEAAHPVPDEAGANATRQMLQLAKDAGPEDLVICLITGGASALTPAPVSGVTLDDLRALTHAMLECGATIHEINALRKHLSQFSGGRLAQAAAPAQVVALIVSDVVGDNLDVIASGPTAPDDSTFDDCMKIIARYGLTDNLPMAVLSHLQQGCLGQQPETPKSANPVFGNVQMELVATNSLALEAAAARARSLGYTPHILTACMTGNAEERARELVAQLRAAPAGSCLLAGGECTVQITGTGKGGRNQHMALAAAMLLEGEKNLAALFAGTDGTDGPTDAAGGFALADTVVRIRSQNSPDELLRNNDSYAALTQARDLLITGPTRTNVMDMAILVSGRP